MMETEGALLIKRWGSVILLMMLSSLLCSGCLENAHILVLTVTEVYDNAFMAQAEEDSGAFAAGDKLYVSAQTLPALQAGDRVEVAFNGLVMTSEPAQIVADAVVVIEGEETVIPPSEPQ